MTADSPPREDLPELWLVVDQAVVPPPGLDELLKDLKGEFGLDPYTARHKLIGRGYNLFGRGRDRAKLSAIHARLLRGGVEAVLFEPRRPAAPVRKLQGLKVRADGVALLVDGGEVPVNGDVAVAAVLADLTGAMVEKTVKRLLTRSAYQGVASVAATEATVRQEIVKGGRAVLDLYLVDAKGGISQGIRAYTARFDASGLGERMTPSAGLNLLALVDLLQERAARLTLRTDFGLANLPGCQLQPAPPNGDASGGNLPALDRFGWLAAQIAVERGSTAEGDGGLTEAIVPVDGVVSAAVAPEVAILTEVLKDDLKQPTAAAPPASPPVPLLPLPPPEEESGWSSGFGRKIRWPDVVGGVGAALLWLAASSGGGRGAANPLWHYAFGLGLLPALAAGFFLWQGVSTLLLRRAIANTPLSKIRSLATGMVEVSGRAVRSCALVSPVTHLPCVYYELSRYRRDQRDRWRLTSRRSSGPVPFAVEDATGRVMVDPAGADLRPGVREEGRGSGGGLLFSGSGDSDEKWVEEVIPEGATVYVLGFAHIQRSAGPSLRERTATRLRDLKGSRELIERFDRDGDGRISQEEWEEARSAVEEEASHEQLAEQGRRKRQEEHLVVAAPPQRNRPFIVAQSLDEQSLIAALGWRMALYFCGAALFIGWTCRQLMIYLSGNPYS